MLFVKLPLKLSAKCTKQHTNDGLKTICVLKNNTLLRVCHWHGSIMKKQHKLFKSVANNNLRKRKGPVGIKLSKVMR